MGLCYFELNANPEVTYPAYFVGSWTWICRFVCSLGTTHKTAGGRDGGRERGRERERAGEAPAWYRRKFSDEPRQHKALDHGKEARPVAPAPRVVVCYDR